MCSGSKSCIVAIIAVIVVVLVASGLLAASFKKVNSDEVGVIYDTIKYTLGEKPVLEGLYSGVPGFEIVKFPNVFKTMIFEDTQCLNKDGIKINLNVEYQYKPIKKALMQIIKDFKDFDSYKESLTLLGRAALHDACSLYTTTQFQSERGAFQDTILTKIQERYDEFNCTVGDLQVNNIAWPKAFEAAIRSKERAREDIVVAKNERPRYVIQANTLKRQAETQSTIIVDKVSSEARIRENKANLEAEAIKLQYQKEAEAYQFILAADGLKYSMKGFISYLGSRVVAGANNPVYISLDSPAKTSYAP